VEGVQPVGEIHLIGVEQTRRTRPCSCGSTDPCSNLDVLRVRSHRDRSRDAEVLQIVESERGPEASLAASLLPLTEPDCLERWHPLAAPEVRPRQRTPSPPRKIKSSLDSTGMRALAVNRVEKAVITPASGTSKRVIWEQLDREARQAFPGLDLLLDSSRSHRPNEARRCTRVSERIGGRGRPRSGRELVELTEGRTGPGLGSAPRRVVTPRPLEHSRSLP